MRAVLVCGVYFHSGLNLDLEEVVVLLLQLLRVWSQKNNQLKLPHTTVQRLCAATVTAATPSTTIAAHSTSTITATIASYTNSL